MQLKDLHIGDIVYYMLVYRDRLLDYSILQIRSLFNEQNVLYSPLMVSFDSIIGNPQVDMWADLELDTWATFMNYSWIYTTNEQLFLNKVKLFKDGN